MRWSSYCCLVFWGAGLFLLALQPALTSAQEVAVRNTNFRQEGTQIIVTYDLIGSKEEEYEATLLLSTSGGRAFDYEPQAISGAVGGGIAPGPGKRVAWNVLEDFPDGLQSQNVQLKVAVEEQGGNGWLYTIGGAVLAGGGALAASAIGLIGGGSGSGGSGSGGSGSGGSGPTPIPPPGGPP